MEVAFRSCISCAIHAYQYNGNALKEESRPAEIIVTERGALTKHLIPA